MPDSQPGEVAAAVAEPLVGRRRVLKSIAVLGTSEMLARLINFASLVIVARILGPEGMGVLAFAIVTITYLAMLSDGGLNNWTKTDIVRDRSNISAFIGDTFVAQLGLAVLVFVGLVGFIEFVPMPDQVPLLILAASPLLVVQALSTDYALQALERMGQAGAVRMSGQLVAAVVSIVGVALTKNPIYAAIGLWIGQAVSAVIAAVLLHASGIRLRIRTRGASHLKRLLRYGLPLAGMGALYPYTATIANVFLGMHSEDAELGWFNAAARLTAIVPAASFVFASALLPEIIRRQSGDNDDLTHALAKSLRAGLGLTISIGGALAVSAPILIHVMFGDSFAPAAPMLAIASFIVPLSMINMLMVLVLTSLHRTKQLLIAHVCGAVVGTIALVVLTPSWHGIGAAWAVIMSSTTAAAIAGVFLTRVVGTGWLRASAVDLAVYTGLGVAIFGAAQVIDNALNLLVLWSVAIVGVEVLRGMPTVKLVLGRGAPATTD